MIFDRHQWQKFIVAVFMVFMGCETEYGEHRMVDLKDEGNALDVTYISYLQDQIEDDPSVSDNYVKLASIYIKQEREQDALSLLQKGAKETEGSVNVLVKLGQLYLGQRNVDQLSALLRSLRNADPDNIDFLKLSAGYALLLRDYTNAIFFANRAMLTNPLDDENMFLMASAKLINKDSVSALNGFLEAYNLNTSFRNFEAVFELSLALDQTENARNYLLEFEKLNSEKDFCHQWGAWYNSVGKSDSARIVLLPCTDALANKGKREYELARTYYPYQTDSALAYVNRSLNQQPNNIPTMVFKAKILERQSNYEQAKNIYQTAIKLDSTSTIAIEGLNNLERKVAYLRLLKRKEGVQKDLEILKPLNSKTIN